MSWPPPKPGPSDGSMLVFFLCLFIVCMTLDLAWNQWFYGDWGCAFAECRRVMP